MLVIIRESSERVLTRSNIHHKLRTRGSLKHRDSHFYHNHSYHHDGQRSEGDYRRDSNREQSGDVRKQRVRSER